MKDNGAIKVIRTITNTVVVILFAIVAPPYFFEMALNIQPDIQAPHLMHLL